MLMLAPRTMTAGRLPTRAAEIQAQNLHQHETVYDRGAARIGTVDRRQENPENAQPSKLLQMRVKT